MGRHIGEPRSEKFVSIKSIRPLVHNSSARVLDLNAGWLSPLGLLIWHVATFSFPFVRAGAAGDRSSVALTVEAIVAEERARSHHTLADRLQRALQSVPVATSSQMPRAQASGRDFIIETEPRLSLSDLILSLPAERLTRQLVEEQTRADLLRAQGLQPRHRVLLSGPPGNGESFLAEAIAEAVAVPLLTVRYDALVGAYLGETNARLARLFEYVRNMPCVLLFDEFDAIGKERGDVHETGEIKRVVSFLLMQIDQLPSYVIAVAATNHAELLDRAVWRRFQLRIDMPAPDLSRAALLLSRCFQAVDEEPWPNRASDRRAHGTSKLR